jgi:hypothetical protein
MTTFHIDHSRADEGNQIVIFAIEGATSSSCKDTFMPFVMGTAMKHGSYTTCARTVASPHSLPAWISLFYSAMPAQSGINDDTQDFSPSTSSLFSFLDLLTDYGYSVEIQSEDADSLKSVLFSRRPIKPFNWIHEDISSHACMETYLPQTENRAFLFHFASVDRMGHVHGYDSHDYRMQLQCVDWQIKEITKCIWRYYPDRTTFFVISNHGGTWYDHDHFDLKTLQVPIIAWGYGISRLADISSLVVAVDTIQFAPTLVELLELEMPSSWRHRPIPHLINASSTACDIVSVFNGDIQRDLEKLSFCPLQAGSLRQGSSHFNAVMVVSSCIIYIVIGIGIFYQHKIKYQ